MTYTPKPGADPEQGERTEAEIIAYATPATSTYTPNYAAAAPTLAVGSGVAVSTSAPADLDMHLQPKQGAKCCGCCCDYRRAVIILNIILTVLGIFAVIIYSQGTRTIGKQLDLDDDGLTDIVEDSYRQSAILAGIGVFGSIVAIIGAYSYNIYMVGFNILYMILSYMLTIVFTNKAFDTLEEDYTGDEDIPTPIGSYIFQAVIVCLFIYPQVGFMFEVKGGILSAKTYLREEHSCCCITKQRYG
jgi:hypothetical protein